MATDGHQIFVVSLVYLCASFDIQLVPISTKLKEMTFCVTSVQKLSTKPMKSLCIITSVLVLKM